MRLALLADIHGNSVALDAVLADVASAGGADAYWLLGDLVALGPDPLGVLERVERLPRVVVVRGNTDRYVVSGEQPPPTLADAARDPDLLPKLVEVAASFAWTQGVLTAAHRIDWLAALPLEARGTLPDGTRILGVHASPGRDEGPGLNSAASSDQLRALVADCDADLVCTGHTHVFLDETVDGIRLVNVGGVSNPVSADRRASYVLLEAAPGAYRLEHRLVAYDYDAVIEQTLRLRHPGSRFIVAAQRGETRGTLDWPRATWDGLPVTDERPFGACVCVWRERAGRREWLLLHRAHHGAEYEGDWAWTPPTGARLPGEALESCAARELREETGLELPLRLVHTANDWSYWLARAPADADVVLDREHDRYEWVSLEDALRRCRPTVVADELARAAGAAERAGQ